MEWADLGLEPQIEAWRAHLRRRQAIHPVDAAELEDHLRERIGDLVTAGLAPDEAFLIAVKRMGAQDDIAAEFAREHSERLWKTLVAPSAGGGEGRAAAHKDLVVALALGAAAALTVKAPALFGVAIDPPGGFYLRNAVLLVLPWLALYFAWKRGLSRPRIAVVAAFFVLAALAANLYPFGSKADTLGLMAAHLPIALWAVVGVAYAGTRGAAARMDFVRFCGELVIYFVLMGLGGGVLVVFTLMLFRAIHIDAGWAVAGWLLPCGAAGAVLVAAWLVEAKQSVIENMAPVLTRIFTPLFTVLLGLFLCVMAVSGRGVGVQREMLIGFDLLLALVLGLLLYSISARDPLAPREGFDILLMALLVCALLADGFALAAIAARIGEMGSTPNRLAGLGMNLVLLGNLGGSAWLYGRFLSGHGSAAAIERWQTGYLPLFALWAAVVAIGFPLAFGFR